MLLNKSIVKIIEEEIDKLTSQTKKNLSRVGKGDSDLSKSIDSDVKGDATAALIMDQYGQFLDQGVSGRNSTSFKGKKKPVFKSKGSFRFGSNSFKTSGGSWEKKIDNWMSDKGIKGSTDSKGRFISKKSKNFLIRRSIYQHGIKGTLFASDAFKDFREELRDRLSNIDFTNIIKTQ